ncbi:uncharacterized protein LOC116619295 [Nematostella vectensis]|uniref:uncharacterized protein LOC116619295 n=1 Tax=Nematostella vectensis TaxID=45351 RepID=UPI00138FF5DD|nr:uncharacterized protein LOC116619295 [Nematostella vectensis]
MTGIRSGVISIFIFLTRVIISNGQLSRLQPGNTAPSFTLQTLGGRIVYTKHKQSSTSKPRHPIIFHAFTSRSAFLEALWTDMDSVESLLKNSPRNTQYVFMSFSDTAKSDVLGMRGQLLDAIHHYYRNSNKSRNDGRAGCSKFLNHTDHKYNHVEEGRSLYKLSSLRHAPNKNKPLKTHVTNTKHLSACDQSPVEQWKQRLHFVELPVYELGNWIPYALNHWKCFGAGCALAQVAFKSEAGNIIRVSERLDARYDWLPSPHALSHNYTHLAVRYYGDACHHVKFTRKSNKDKQNAGDVDEQKNAKRKKKRKASGKIALVSAAGNCSLFTKIVHMSRADVDAVLIYQSANEPVEELSCKGHHCFFPLRVAASMIPHRDGMAIRDRLLAGEKLHASFQFTPQENYFLAIDGQGKLAEVGLFLYPSMMFMGYEAKWFNYKTDLIHNLTGSAKIIHVFNHTRMQGHTGAVANVILPPFKELQLYRNVELDLSLHCKGENDFDCPHWDHVVQLEVCCDKKSTLCGEELGRWITPYRRTIGRWLTPITPLLPLFAESRKCTLTLKHPFWERAWRPSLSIRLSDHIHYSKHHYSGQKEDEFIVPFKITKLFKGGTFNKTYNKRYKPIQLRIPAHTARVKLVATITGHGSDNHGCAEFCVTSHHFIINKKPNVRVFKNAATSKGCAERVEEGVTPNEHGTWLYGRDGWCCGQDVVPWVTDVTDQVKLNGKTNTIEYFGWFNGTDPNPKMNAGNILMNSYLVYYKSILD